MMSRIELVCVVYIFTAQIVSNRIKREHFQVTVQNFRYKKLLHILCQFLLGISFLHEIRFLHN